MFVSGRQHEESERVEIGSVGREPPQLIQVVSGWWPEESRREGRLWPEGRGVPDGREVLEGRGVPQLTAAAAARYSALLRHPPACPASPLAIKV